MASAFLKAVDREVPGAVGPEEAGGPALAARVKTIIAAFEDRPHVFNLGHGIGQFTPISHVEELLAALRG